MEIKLDGKDDFIIVIKDSLIDNKMISFLEQSIARAIDRFSYFLRNDFEKDVEKACMKKVDLSISSFLESSIAKKAWKEACEEVLTEEALKKVLKDMLGKKLGIIASEELCQKEGCLHIRGECDSDECSVCHEIRNW